MFNSSKFGDDTDRPLQKSDNSYTYFASDIAYHKNKIDRQFDELIIILGADHGGYVKRLKSVVSALSDDKTKLDVILVQLVKLLENGEIVKMSKRAGNFVTMREVLEKVGKDILRFIMLTRKADAPLDFDLAKVVETTKDNPVFYVQYAHARISSIKRNAKEAQIDFDDINALKPQFLNDPTEIKLLKKIAQYPRMIETAATQREPHRITYYLHELASDFHQMWHEGKEKGIKIINPENHDESKARILLCSACGSVISSGLKILGAEPVERM